MGDRAQDELSPDGRTLVQWSESDGRMSHVIRTPTIIDAASGDTILKLGDSGYDATVGWGEDGGFDLDLRHYWRSGTLRLTVDPAGGTFRIAGADDSSPSHPLRALSAFIEDHFTAADRAASASAAGPSLEERLARERRSGNRALWILLALGAGAAIWALFLRG
jgi:hypothetical protein